MCGRYTTAAALGPLTKAFPFVHFPDALPLHYNVAPTQAVPVIASDNAEQVQFFQWGLIPSWAKDPAIGNRMINARAETLAEKPSFRTAFKRRRCLVLADGFYEWRKEPRGAKTPFYFRLKGREPFAFAGLWEEWTDPATASPLRSCTIITTSANEMLKPIHERMPVILHRVDDRSWLSPETSPQDLTQLLAAYPADAMEAIQVSTLVNNPRNDMPECMQPV